MMTSRPSLEARYFDDIFDSDDDPWQLASSDYEAGKFTETIDAISDRRYGRGLEVGCAHGVLTSRLVGLCDTLLAVDISGKALAKARERVGDRPGLELSRMAFPKETPEGPPFDLVVLSEVAYYWGLVDLDRTGEWLPSNVRRGGRVILVHYIGDTDYPHSGDKAVTTLWSAIGSSFDVLRADRMTSYRLDLWARR